AALAVRSDGHGVAEQHIAADLGGGDCPFQRPAVDRVAHGVVAQVVVDELTTVGQPGRGLLHVGLSISSLSPIAHNPTYKNMTHHGRQHHNQTKSVNTTVQISNTEA